jgi:heavy metal sensor kinase
MFKSIRGGLLFWYALILVAVLGAFGGTLYYKQRHSLLKEVDGTLGAHAQAMAASIEVEPGGLLELELTDEYSRYFRSDGGEDDPPYFAIWDGSGKVLKNSRPDLEPPRPEAAGVRTRGSRREIAAAGPAGSMVLVGRKIGEEQQKLRDFLGGIVGAGAGMILLALAGGWFLTGRAIRPIGRMTEAASAISSSNLSHRIDVAQTQTELGRLAATLNEAFDRLERAFDRQTRFTADASHELRTPLSIVLAQAELALSRERSLEEYRKGYATTLQAAQRMKAVVEGLLTLARADAREINLRKERVDLRAIVEETLSMLGPMALPKKVAVKLHAETVHVTGDPDRLREVVTNLVTNAVRYNREGGRVDVSLKADGKDAVLAVADTGIGIPAADQPHVFERFYRVDKARARDEGGSGLGLAITKWIVESHGGSIAFTSREGEETTFTIRMPRRE